MLDPQQSLAALALEHPECEAVLRRFNLDLCGHGQAPLARACAERGVPLRDLLAALDEVLEQGSDPMLLDPRTFSSHELAEHLCARYGGLARRALPQLRKVAAHLARVHGDAGLCMLSRELDRLAVLLEANLQDLERSLLAPLREGGRPAPPLLERLGAGQREVLALLDEVRTAATGFVAPSEACPSWSALYRDLAMLEAEVLRRLHLEANLLFPQLRA